MLEQGLRARFGKGPQAVPGKVAQHSRRKGKGVRQPLFHAKYLDTQVQYPEIDDSPDSAYDPELEDYYDYEALGADKFDAQDGRFIESGYVGISDDIQLYEILDGGNHQMGGIE